MAGLLTLGLSYSPHLPVLKIRQRTVAFCGFCPRLQRRVRAGFTPASLLSLQGTIKLYTTNFKLRHVAGRINQPKPLVKFFAGDKSLAAEGDLLSDGRP